MIFLTVLIGVLNLAAFVWAATQLRHNPKDSGLWVVVVVNALGFALNLTAVLTWL